MGRRRSSAGGKREAAAMVLGGRRRRRMARHCGCKERDPLVLFSVVRTVSQQFRRTGTWAEGEHLVVHLLKLVTGVDTSTRPATSSGRPGKAKNSTSRKAAAAKYRPCGLFRLWCDPFISRPSGRLFGSVKADRALMRPALSLSAGWSWRYLLPCHAGTLGSVPVAPCHLCLYDPCSRRSTVELVWALRPAQKDSSRGER